VRVIVCTRLLQIVVQKTSSRDKQVKVAAHSRSSLTHKRIFQCFIDSPVPVSSKKMSES
jgi:hypothetical protein